MTMQNDPNAGFIESARKLRERVGERRSCDDFAVPGETATRRARSLQTCHRFKVERPPRVWRATSGYVPELAARIEDDPNLTDGARRCARKIAEATYRQNREGRVLAVTVTYLARALGRCRRSVQRYLRQLEGAGYIEVDVVTAERTRLCIGLAVRLLEPMFPRHHKVRWPGVLGNPGATEESRIQSPIIERIEDGSRIPVLNWAARSMNGVFTSFMKTKPLAGLPPILTA